MRLRTDRALLGLRAFWRLLPDPSLLGKVMIRLIGVSNPRWGSHSKTLPGCGANSTGTPGAQG